MRRKTEGRETSMKALTKPLLVGTGWLCVGLGIFGILLATI